MVQSGQMWVRRPRQHFQAWRALHSDLVVDGSEWSDVGETTTSTLPAWTSSSQWPCGRWSFAALSGSCHWQGRWFFNLVSDVAFASSEASCEVYTDWRVDSDASRHETDKHTTQPNHDSRTNVNTLTTLATKVRLWDKFQREVPLFLKISGFPCKL